MLTFGCDSCRMVVETTISVRRLFASIIEYCRQNAASNYCRRDGRLPMVFAGSTLFIKETTMSDQNLQGVLYSEVRSMQLRTAEPVPFSAGFLEFVFLRGLEAFEAGLSAEQRVQLGGLLTVYAGVGGV